MNIYDDTDDDDLSDISEKSREDDASELGVNKNLQSINAAHADNKKVKSHSDSPRTPTSSFYTPEPTTSSAYKNVPNDEKPELTTTHSDPNPQENVSSPIKKLVVQARRLEQSDSDDTTSATESHPAKQSAPDVFYSPEESVDDENDTDDPQQSKPWKQREQNQTTQVKSSDKKEIPSLSKFSNQQQSDTDEDDNSRSSETSSTGSQKTPVPIGKMAWGEPDTHIYIYIYILRSVLHGLNTNTMCVCGVSVFHLSYNSILNDITA